MFRAWKGVEVGGLGVGYRFRVVLVISDNSFTNRTGIGGGRRGGVFFSLRIGVVW